MESIHKLSPHLSTRHWYFYDHLFTCGISAGVVCIISPGSSMASDAWEKSKYCYITMWFTNC